VGAGWAGLGVRQPFHSSGVRNIAPNVSKRLRLGRQYGRADDKLLLRRGRDHICDGGSWSEDVHAWSKEARAVGLNHLALEVGDIEAALTFYGRLFNFELRGKNETSAFIDLGDQFLALQKGRTRGADGGRHFGLVVDDKEAVRAALTEAGVTILPGRFLDFRDPWGNRIEIVGYENIQFTKAPNVLRAMGLTHLGKNDSATRELTQKGMAPEDAP
jgi:predicted enzyme related to lactoylglutathione lyase